MTGIAADYIPNIHWDAMLCQEIYSVSFLQMRYVILVEPRKSALHNCYNLQGTQTCKW